MRSKIYHLLLISILVFVYFQWFLPGPRVATDFSLVSDNSLKNQLDLPQTWSTKGTEGLGEYTVFTLWSWPFSLLVGLFANLNISLPILERILMIIPFLSIGTIGIWRLGKKINLSPRARFISTLFYLINTYILLLIDGGQLTIALAFAFFPLAFAFFEDSLYKTYKRKIIAGLLVSIIGVFDIRFIYIFLLLCFIKFITEFTLESMKDLGIKILEWIKTGLVFGLLILGLNAYWVIVILKYPISLNFYQYLTQTSFPSFISFEDALFLYSPHWYKNVFGQLSTPPFYFILIPLLVFAAPFLRKKSKEVSFWFLVAVIGIFLTKGTSEPLSFLYQWFYYHIPGFSLFRDSSKFFFLIALSYSMLIGVTFDEIFKFKFIKRLLLPLLVIYLLFLVRPIWLGSMTGTFSKPFLEDEYRLLNRRFTEDKTNTNVFWIPNIAPMASLNEKHPAVEAVRLVQKRPFAQGVIGTYETFNFLREAPYMQEIFKIANIGYIVYPPLDLRREEDKDKVEYYSTFLNQLSNLPWLTLIKDSEIPLLKVNKTEEKIFIAPNIWWVVGSDDIYNEATKSSQMTLAKNAMVFSEENIGMGEFISQLDNLKIVLNHKSTLDLAASFITRNNLIFPAQYLKNDPDSSGWWKRNTNEFINWKDFLKTKYGIVNKDFDLGGGWAVAEGKLKLKLKDKKIVKGNILLMRVLESTRSGQINIYQDNQLIGQIPTKKKGDNVHWFEVGPLSKNDEIDLESEGDINVVNTIALLDKSSLENFKEKTLQLSDRVKDFNQKNIEDFSSEVSYKQITPTKFEIKVSGLKNPSMMMFSQNFDKNWKLSGQSPIMVYSLLNGYYIERDGNYNLEFEPQKLIPIGVTISVITLIFCLILLFI